MTASTASRAGIWNFWRLFLIEGIVLVVLGMAAIAVPPLASIAAATFLGWLFLVGGAVSLVTTAMARGMPGFWWSLVSAMVSVGAGLVLIAWPIGGAISLTLVLTAFLMTDGVLLVFLSLAHRSELKSRWGFLLANGILDLLLAGLIVWALPGAAFWVLGLIVGIDLLFAGMTLIAIALAARQAGRSIRLA